MLASRGFPIRLVVGCASFPLRGSPFGVPRYGVIVGCRGRFRSKPDSRGRRRDPEAAWTPLRRRCGFFRSHGNVVGRRYDRADGLRDAPGDDHVEPCRANSWRAGKVEGSSGRPGARAALDDPPPRHRRGPVARSDSSIRRWITRTAALCRLASVGARFGRVSRCQDGARHHQAEHASKRSVDISIHQPIRSRD